MRSFEPSDFSDEESLPQVLVQSSILRPCPFLIRPKTNQICSITATSVGVDCKHSLPLTTLCLTSTTEINVIVRPPVLNQKWDILKICDVASGRTDGHGIYPQRDGRKSYNHWTSVYTINRIGRVCSGHFPSTLKSSAPDWIRTNSREKFLLLL